MWLAIQTNEGGDFPEYNHNENGWLLKMAIEIVDFPIKNS